MKGHGNMRPNVCPSPCTTFPPRGHGVITGGKSQIKKPTSLRSDEKAPFPGTNGRLRPDRAGVTFCSRRAIDRGMPIDLPCIIWGQLRLSPGFNWKNAFCMQVINPICRLLPHGKVCREYWMARADGNCEACGITRDQPACSSRPIIDKVWFDRREVVLKSRILLMVASGLACLFLFSWPALSAQYRPANTYWPVKRMADRYGNCPNGYSRLYGSRPVSCYQNCQQGYSVRTNVTVGAICVSCDPGWSIVSGPNPGVYRCKRGSGGLWGQD